MYNRRIQPLFSIVAVGLSLALAGGGTYALIDKLPKPPTKQEIKVEPNVITIPTVEVPPATPEPLQVNTPPVETPKPKATNKVTNRPSPAVKVAQVALAAQPCELVCEDKWNDSVLFADGSRYKNCKCK